MNGSDCNHQNILPGSGSFERREAYAAGEDVHFLERHPARAEGFKTPEEALKTLFGYDAFRPGQKSVIDSLLSGQDTLAVMPTGAGKSLCYQIPAMLLPGITLVVSPLISLMQDQVKALNEAGIPAAFINSALTENAFYETLYKAKRGLYKIIYVAPERLLTEAFTDLVKSVPVSMITVDEAHCISQWGQDFRPSYRKIAEFTDMLATRPVIGAFTATATEKVREDIVASLRLNRPFIQVTGFNRENLFFQVEAPADKDKYILDYISKHPQESGIIYCATRKNTDNLHTLLKSRGIAAVKYHAGMSNEERKKMQDDFIFDYAGIVVATNAFGMGIDKPNVRFVIHYNMPQSMENYYQEAGRAGRDGLEAKCVLLYAPQDVIINKFLIEHKEMPDTDEEERATVSERDRQRLRVMERYCHTPECLRNFILEYFGETPTAPCGDCGNCLSEFETLDMTDAAKKIINCVYEARGRYGKEFIIEAVTGAKTARLKETGAVNYKSYGALPGANRDLLRHLVEQLVSEGYLKVGEYSVLEMGDIRPLKFENAKVLVKITAADKLRKKPAKKARGVETLGPAGLELFEKLKALRLTLAREENLPPYIIFGDKTLLDMAVKLPLSKPEMMKINGMGDYKYIRFGKKFLSFIEEYAAKHPEPANEKTERETAQQAEKAEKAEKRKEKREKPAFFLTLAEAENFDHKEYMYISEIAEEMNRICQTKTVKRLQARQLTEILLEKELITEQKENEYTAKAPTAKGLAAGIKPVEKVSANKKPYTLLVYPENIQRMLAACFVKEE